MQRSAKGVLVPRVVIALRPTKEITPPFHTAYPRVVCPGLAPGEWLLTYRESLTSPLWFPPRMMTGVLACRLAGIIAYLHTNAPPANIFDGRQFTIQLRCNIFRHSDERFGYTSTPSHFPGR